MTVNPRRAEPERALQRALVAPLTAELVNHLIVRPALTQALAAPGLVGPAPLAVKPAPEVQVAPVVKLESAARVALAARVAPEALVVKLVRVAPVAPVARVASVARVAPVVRSHLGLNHAGLSKMECTEIVARG